MKEEEEADPPSPQQPEIGEEERKVKEEEVVEQPSRNDEISAQSDEDYEDVDGVGGVDSNDDVKVPIWLSQWIPGYSMHLCTEFCALPSPLLLSPVHTIPLFLPFVYAFKPF